MATTLYLCSPSQETSHEDLQNNPSRSEPAKSRSKTKLSRSNGGSFSQKKQPQRGLGVAQLERLRIQEQKLKIKEANLQAQNSQFQFPFADNQNANAAFARFGYGGVVNEDQAPFQCLLQRYMHSSGVRTPFSDQICGDRTGVSNGRFQFQNQMEELSSNQSVQCLSDQCVDCVKRRKMQIERLGFHGMETRFGEISKLKDVNDFLELALWNNSSSSSNSNSNKSVVEDEINAGICEGKLEMNERLAVGAKKGKSIADTQLMEYDFFPVKRGTKSSNSSSSASRTAGGSSPPHLVDLSLKLSSF